MTLRKEIHEAAIIPTGYGLAWWDWSRPIAICYPIPLNVLVSLARRFWLALKHFGKQDREIAAYQAGMDTSRRSQEIQLNFIRDQHAQKELDAYQRGRREAVADLKALVNDVSELRKMMEHR